MSKAFTRESDDAVEEPILTRQPLQLPPGIKNYITVDGARRLRQELDDLTQVERPRLSNIMADESLAESSAAAEAKRQIKLLDQRIFALDQSLQSAEIVEPPAGANDVVRFGATVTVHDNEGEEMQYRIVGIDETDIDRDWVSWRSPIARALLNAHLGQAVRFKFPAGEKELKIVGITYE